MRRIVRALLVVFVLAVLYPLSAGPFTWVLFHGGIPGVGPSHPAFHAFYYPLTRLPEPLYRPWIDYVYRWI